MNETMVPSNGVDLCVEAFGERADPPLLLIAGGASSMDWWEDEFCRRLAAGGRYVIRYDHRDTGRSTSFPPGAPPYSQKDLADDPLGLLDVLDLPSAHVVGLSMGGGIAQRIAVEHPGRVRSLTLMSTTAVMPTTAGPDPVDHEPDHAGANSPDSAGDANKPGSTAGADEPDPASGANSPDSAGDADEPDPASGADGTDWSDRKAAVDRLVTDVRRLGGPFTADEPQLRRLAERVFDRTTDMAASQANHWLAVPGAPIRGRLAAITAPTLVLHGTLDPLFPVAAAQALAREIPGARLIMLDGVGHEYPPAALWQVVITELLRHTG